MSVQEEIKLDLTISDDAFVEDCMKVIVKARPSWDPATVKNKVFDGGITNKLVGFYPEGKKKEMILVRIYGAKTDLLIDRQAEKNNMKMLHAQGIGAALLASFSNGICYDFIPGDVLDEKSVREPKIASLIAREMVGLHTMTVPGLDQPRLYDMLRKFYSLIPRRFEDPAKQERYSREVPHPHELGRELERLISHLESQDATPAYCHNDLLLKNIVYNEEKERCYFIDHEYGCVTFLEFDIGDHFCEYAGVDTVDYSLYPDKTYQLEWLTNYLRFYKEAGGRGAEPVTQGAAQALYARVNKFALAAHFFWGLWGLIQACHSLIDFDFVDYAILRLNEYFAKRDEFFALKSYDESCE